MQLFFEFIFKKIFKNKMNFSVRESLFKFVQSQCEKCHIDDSHGLIHSKRCISWVDLMIDRDKTLTDEQKIVAIYSAAVHDLCDKKYVQIFEAINELREWLNKQICLTEEMVEGILSIIQTMSYSFLYQRRYEDGKHWYPDHGKWDKSYHLARNADLLEGYDVGRCYIYTKRVYQEWTNDEVWERVEDFFHKRMYKYLSDGWLTNPYAIECAPSLEEKAKICFQTRLWEYT